MKWSKGKVRDKLDNQVLFDNVTYEKLLKEVPAYRLITPSIVSERHKVRGSLARKALTELLNKGVEKYNGCQLPEPQIGPFSSTLQLCQLLGVP
ncbi:unnamed protein product [Nezara viridula]|uniref:40S ribosomal protein S25 n=1 Tax=Nezara viridula TaxID=85310 RepID=A0A9P0MS52_NEZVI|nr:unnamed protein product [Nezara viridula]